MCLFVDDNKILIAKHDIPVYKELLVEARWGAYHGRRLVSGYSPYQRMPYERGITHKSKLYKQGETVNVGLHAFTTRSKNRDARYSSWTKLVKMVIPKGARYIRGTFCGVPCVATNKLVWR